MIVSFVKPHAIHAVDCVSLVEAMVLIGHEGGTYGVRSFLAVTYGMGEELFPGWSSMVLMGLLGLSRQICSGNHCATESH